MTGKDDAVWSLLAPFHEGRHRRCAFHYSISFQLELVKRSRRVVSAAGKLNSRSSSSVTSTEISSTRWPADQTSLVAGLSVLKRLIFFDSFDEIEIVRVVLFLLLSRGRIIIIIIITRVSRGKVAVKTRFLERFLMPTFPIDRPWVMHRLLYLCAPTTRGLKVGRCFYESSLGRALVSRLTYPRSSLSARESQTRFLYFSLSLSPKEGRKKFSHEWINRVTIMADLSSRPIKLDPRSPFQQRRFASRIPMFPKKLWTAAVSRDFAVVVCSIAALETLARRERSGARNIIRVTDFAIRNESARGIASLS